MASTTAGQERSKEAEDLSIEDAGEGLLELLPGDDDLSMEDQLDADEAEDKKKRRKKKAADEGGDGDTDDDDDDGDAGDAGDDDDEGAEDAEGDADDTGAEGGDEDDDDEIEVFTVKVAGKDVDVSAEELVNGYSRTADYTRKTQQLAEDRKKVDSELAETQGARQSYLENLKLLNKSLKDLHPQPDWEQVKRDRPDSYATEYADWQRQDGQRQKLRDEETLVEEDNRKDIESRTRKYLTEERALLEKALPALTDEVKGAELTAEMAAYAERRFGVPRDQFESVQNHTLLVMLHDSMELDKLKSGTRTLRRKRVKKGKTKVLQPGSRPTSSVRRKKVRRSQLAGERLRQTGTIEAGAAALFDLED
ncbi:hypothetical protein LCGC14_2118240, partial [marine sediment metagenome]